MTKLSLYHILILESTGIARKAIQQFTAMLLRNNQYNNPCGTVSFKIMSYPVWGLGHTLMLLNQIGTKQTASGYSEGSKASLFYWEDFDGKSTNHKKNS